MTTLDIGLIGGCGSSGTTLLAHLLDGIGDLRCSPEAYVFHQQRLYSGGDFKRELYRALSQLSPRVVYEAGGLKHVLVPPTFIAARDFFGLTTVDDEYELYRSADSMTALVSHLKANMERRHGFTAPFLWIDQTPKNVLTAATFLDSIPGGRFIHLIRDGRDVVASLAKRYAVETPGRSRTDYLKVGAMRWCYDVSHGLRARGQPGYLERRYEDLAADPLTSVNAILRHLGRPGVDESGLREKKSYAAEHFPFLFLGGEKPSWSAQPTDAVSTRAVGKWRHELGEEELSMLVDTELDGGADVGRFRFGELLEKLGYV
jgi:Sulfotransferase family